ncbi:unnamed protein product [Schistosoma haematobium]|nr:unnamed protein product [Schistosoma haematobium]
MEGVRTVTLKSNSSFSAAQRRGDHIETHKRWAAGQNKQRTIEKNTAKLEEDTEDLHNDLVDMDVVDKGDIGSPTSLCIPLSIKLLLLM